MRAKQGECIPLCAEVLPYKRTVSRTYRRKLDAPRALTLIERTLRAASSGKNLRNFLEGLLTPSERDMLAQRLRVAWLLQAGHSFRLIRYETGASFRTIVKIDRWLRKENPQYRRLFPIRTRNRTSSSRSLRTARPLPGSIKHFTRSLLGTDVF